MAEPELRTVLPALILILLLSCLTSGAEEVKVLYDLTVEGEVGQNITLRCGVQNSTSSKLQFIQTEWSKKEGGNSKLAVYHHSLGLQLFRPGVSLQTESQDMMMGSYLHLHGLSRSDRGVYVCDITTFPLGSIRRETEVKVKGLQFSSTHAPEATPTQEPRPPVTQLSTLPSDPTEPDPTEPNHTEPDPTEPDHTEPDPTEPDPTEPDPTEPDHTGPDPTEPEPRTLSPAVTDSGSVSGSAQEWSTERTQNQTVSGPEEANRTLTSEGRPQLRAPQRPQERTSREAQLLHRAVCFWCCSSSFLSCCWSLWLLSSTIDASRGRGWTCRLPSNLLLLQSSTQL
ncbi:uncharacterized protein LOC142990461 [Genypterus blacodes]|uniref:uncharacterized protein LOC142990461 n=1 Tax=Genypterus blacodes TaxID=154954 RepID=UPI003F775E05